MHETQKAHKNLKDALILVPGLTLPDDTKKFQLITNTCLFTFVKVSDIKISFRRIS